MNKPQKVFIARTIYHHRQQTDRRVVLIVYRDSQNAFELFDTRDTDGSYVAGDQKWVLSEWRRLNQELIEEGFQRDDLRGEPEFQQFI